LTKLSPSTEQFAKVSDIAGDILYKIDLSLKRNGALQDLPPKVKASPCNKIRPRFQFISFSNSIRDNTTPK
jgi:hypothetical protein